MKRSCGIHTYVRVLYEPSVQSISIFCHSQPLPRMLIAYVRNISNWLVATAYVYAFPSHPFREAGSVRWQILLTPLRCPLAVFGDQPSLSQITFVSRSFKTCTWAKELCLISESLCLTARYHYEELNGRLCYSWAKLDMRLSLRVAE
jgi:hypothetical protein